MSKPPRKKTVSRSNPGKRPSSSQDARHSQFVDFLEINARSSGSRNADHFLSSGSLEDKEDLRQAGIKFLTMAMGFDEREWIPYIGGKDDPQFVPQSEDFYPWVLFVVPTNVRDLQLFYDQTAKQWLFSDAAGQKRHVVITNLKELCVFDLNHRQSKYDFTFSTLLDDLNSHAVASSDKRSSLNKWVLLLSDFGPESAVEKKKKRRAEVIQYQDPSQSKIQLSFAKRFGHMPDLEHPVGWDGLAFREAFKTKDLPFMTTEEFTWDGSVKKIENKIIWGDNLSVMRSMPDCCIDLIYIDPPFFSGRNYNCIFGDDDEVRTFSDIWDGGLPTYLAWLNARLWEMKRLLKQTGNIVVHLDRHACHYVKIELDKIFGPENFQNEIIWSYRTGGASKRRFGQKHDNLFWYSKDHKAYKYNCIKERIYYEKAFFSPAIDEEGRYYADIIPDDTWEVKAVLNISKERIGYPTQKPEELLKKIINALTEPGDVVADFCAGGGTTIAVSEKLGRKWIGCDISRIAVGVARDRMARIYEHEVGIERLKNKPSFGFSIQHHGAYDRAQIRSLNPDTYVAFMLKCFGAQKKAVGDTIHGFKEHRAVSITPAKIKLGADQVDAFYDSLESKKIDSGYLLAWGATKDAEARIRDLRKGVGGPTIQLIQVDFVDIDSHEFKGDNIRFFNKPAAIIKVKHISGTTWKFDATASTGTNGVPIHRFQWDFDHKHSFKPSINGSFTSDKDGDGNPLNDYRILEYTFPHDGIFKVALKIFDKLGAEAIEERIIESVGRGKAS